MADKTYISKGYQDRIEVSLAEISSSPNDEFALVKTFYAGRPFKCEMDGHYPCLYAFVIKNVQTNVEMTVGSECVKHFKDKGVDIDLANGLKKRVKRIARKMRRLMKKNLDENQYEKLDKIAKRSMTIKLFMQYQVKEQLRTDEGGKRKALLKKDDIEKILDDPDVKEMTAKTKKAISDYNYRQRKKEEADKAKKEAKKAAKAKAKAA